MNFNLKLIVCCLLILLVSIEDFAFGDENKALAFLEDNNLTLHDVVGGIHEFNHKLAFGIIYQLGHNPNSLLHEIYPEATKLVNATFDRIHQCYDSSIIGNEVNIFHRPIGKIVVKYFHSYVEHLNIANLKEYVKQIKTLLHTLVHLAKHVLECAFNHDEGFEPTKLGLTPFSVYTNEEFAKMFSNKQLDNDDSEEEEEEDDDDEAENKPKSPGLLLGMSAKSKKKGHKCELSVDEIAQLSKVKSIDWREHGIVSPVKNQGQCSSCYIFSATGTMETAYMKKFNTSVVFNEQTFLDCFYNKGGCSLGGVIKKIWKYAMKKGVVLNDDGDKYTSSVNKCKPKPTFTYPTNYCKFNPGGKPQMDKAAQLEAMIVKYGAVAVAIKSTSRDFNHLRGPWNKPCIGESGYEFKDQVELDLYNENPTVDHAVIAVGFNEKYWIIKNSWGINWGSNGYLLLPKRDENNCGILSQAGVPFFGEQNPNSSVSKPPNTTEYLNSNSSTLNPTKSTESNSETTKPKGLK